MLFRHQEGEMFDLTDRFDSRSTGSPRMPQNAQEARQLLVKGNRDFVDRTETRHRGKKKHAVSIGPRRFDGRTNERDAPAQAPFAAVLGCADARAPTEMVFGRGCNELFVVRVAGNVLGQECIGSLRYAVSHFASTLKVLVVLGHANCGAVTEAVDVYLQPHQYLQIATDYCTRSIVDQMLVAVRVAAISMEELFGAAVIREPQYRNALIEVAVALNAAWNAYCLQQEFRSSGVHVVFGAYDLISRYVRLPLSPSSQVTEEEKGLFPPPDDAEDFRQLSRRICSGELVRSLLQKKERAA